MASQNLNFPKTPFLSSYRSSHKITQLFMDSPNSTSTSPTPNPHSPHKANCVIDQSVATTWGNVRSDDSPTTFTILSLSNDMPIPIVSCLAEGTAKPGLAGVFQHLKKHASTYSGHCLFGGAILPNGKFVRFMFLDRHLTSLSKGRATLMKPTVFAVLEGCSDELEITSDDLKGEVVIAASPRSAIPNQNPTPTPSPTLPSPIEESSSSPPKTPQDLKVTFRGTAPPTPTPIPSTSPPKTYPLSELSDVKALPPGVLPASREVSERAL